MTDPNEIDIDESSIYIKTTHSPGEITHPEDSGEEDARTFTVHHARRGQWGFQYFELEGDQEDIAKALVRDEKNERLTTDEFADLLEKRPDYEYLRVSRPGAARRIAKTEKFAESITAEEIQ